MMRRFVAYGPSLAVAATAGLTLLAGPEAIRQIQTAQTAATVSVAQQRLDEDSLLDRMNESIRDIATAVEPSVVYIESRGEGGERRFGRSSGSGWVYDAQGHIVTNAHVVTGAKTIRVNFSDGALREATFVGMDESTDIAVIKVDADPGALVAARRGTGEPVHQGDMVFAFGSPFGFKFSMSKGIVSGLGRDAVTDARATRYSNFIQTDAAINPGNSGGPLVDVNGRVIGMNTAIITDINPDEVGDRSNTGVSMGIGFAIPLETIESVVSQLIGQGVVLRGFIGAQLVDVEAVARFQPSRLQELGYERTTGVIINGVVPGLPADKAGLQAGDIVTSVNGRLTPNTTVLRSVIGNQRPDATVRVEFFREGQALERSVTLVAARVNADGQLVPVEAGEQENATPARNDDAPRRDPFSPEPSVAERLASFGFTDLTSAGDGVAVTGVRDGSDAARAGFSVGDRIIGVGGRAVTDVASFQRELLVELENSGRRGAAVIVRDASGGERRASIRLDREL